LNIKNIISEEIAQNKSLQNGTEKTIENTIEKTLFKSIAYVFAAGIILYIVGRFFL